MQADFSRKLRKAVSHERLDGYTQRGATGGDDNLFTHYAWNIALSESLYAPLLCLEVSLRNNIHSVISHSYGDQTWYNIPNLLKGQEDKQRVEKAKTKLRERNKPLEAGHVVAELTFGFWTSLFDTRYEQVLWPRLLESVVPGIPRKIRTRAELSRRLNDIRNLRNRVFHYEPIWYWSDLQAKHDKILEFTSWLNPSMPIFTAAVDSFPRVYANGMSGFQKVISVMGEKPISSATSPAPVKIQC